MILRLCTRAASLVALLLCVFVGVTPNSAVSAHGQGQQPKPKGHPKLALRANPEMGIAPLRVVATVELTGGADDDQDYYCPKVVWRWGDDSESTTEADCDPYVPGKSEIKRHYAVEHRYKDGGRYELTVFFKQGDKVINSAKVTITVQGETKMTATAARLSAPRRF